MSTEKMTGKVVIVSGGNTGVGFLFGQVALESKRFVTICAFEPLVGSVGLQVSTQVRSIRERLATSFAVIGLLAGVGAQVATQEPRPRELFAAHSAPVPHSVREDVHR